MGSLVVFFVVLCVIGIFVLAWHPKAKGKTKQEFMEALAKFTRGQLETSADPAADSYKVHFKHEELDFTFEEKEVPGFNEKTVKVTLQVKTASPLTLYFTERKTEKLIHYGFEDSESVVDKRVQVPISLGMFSAFTNDNQRAARLLKDKEIEALFNYYKYVDLVGVPHMPLHIIAGNAALEYHVAGEGRPNLNDLRLDIHTIEPDLAKLVMLANYLKKIEHELEEKDKNA